MHAPLALTMGDPAGIGGELTLRAWLLLRAGPDRFVALDDPDRLATLAKHMGLDIPIRIIASPDQAECFSKGLPVIPIRLKTQSIPGHPDSANAPSVIASIEHAVALTRQNRTGAVVTNPISKSVLYAAGFPHPGHTEFLGALTGGTPIMMLASPHLRVVPVTIHVSLRRALDSLTTQGIIDVTRATAHGLRRDFAIAAPRLAIAGLNPHAGEEGALGDEEQKIIRPAIAALRAEGHDVSGPWPPDTMFTPAARTRYDAAICMYHDQALIPLKTLDMTNGVNVTLGLPIVRTSPDHGTAFDIAGTGTADPASLLAALRMAAEIVGHRQQNQEKAA